MVTTFPHAVRVSCRTRLRYIVQYASHHTARTHAVSVPLQHDKISPIDLSNRKPAPRYPAPVCTTCSLHHRMHPGRKRTPLSMIVSIYQNLIILRYLTGLIYWTNFVCAQYLPPARAENQFLPIILWYHTHLPTRTLSPAARLVRFVFLNRWGDHWLLPEDPRYQHRVKEGSARCYLRSKKPGFYQVKEIDIRFSLAYGTWNHHYSMDQKRMVSEIASGTTEGTDGCTYSIAINEI